MALGANRASKKEFLSDLTICYQLPSGLRNPIIPLKVHQKCGKSTQADAVSSYHALRPAILQEIELAER
jgi:hypothetical protein